MFGWVKKLFGRKKKEETKAAEAPKPEEKPADASGVLEEVKPEEVQGDAPKEGQ